jgi:hypothetical protein
MTSPIPETVLADRLPDWWRPLGVSLDGRVDQRREAIEKFANKLAIGDLVSTVGYAHGDREAGKAVIELLRAAAREFDDTFAGDVEDAEPAAMAAAALAHHLAVNPAHRDSTVISLLALSAQWRHLDPAIAGQALATYAELQLTHASASTRLIPALSASPPMAKQVATILQEVEPIPAGSPQIQEPQLTPVLTSHASAISKLASRIDLLATRISGEQRVIREQLGVQQWLLEEWCAAASRPWPEVPAEATPLTAALELADLTLGVAPAVDADVLLASTIAKAGADPTATVQPLAALDATVAVTADNPYSGAPAPELFPLSAAHDLVSSRAGQARSKARRLVGAGKRPLLDIAQQGYRELLLLRALDGE